MLVFALYCCTFWVSFSSYSERLLNSACNYYFYLLNDEVLVYSYDLYLDIYSRYCLFFYYSYSMVINSCYSSSFFFLYSYYILFPIIFVSLSYSDIFLLNSSVSNWFYSILCNSFAIFIYIYYCKLKVYLFDYETLASNYSLNAHWLLYRIL